MYKLVLFLETKEDVYSTSDIKIGETNFEQLLSSKDYEIQQDFYVAFASLIDCEEQLRHLLYQCGWFNQNEIDQLNKNLEYGNTIYCWDNQISYNREIDITTITNEQIKNVVRKDNSLFREVTKEAFQKLLSPEQLKVYQDEVKKQEQMEDEKESLKQKKKIRAIQKAREVLKNV